jgi:hypothetical protein
MFKHTSKQHPLPSPSLLTTTLPPCSSKICFEIHRPIPLPPPCRFLFTSNWTISLNALGRFSGTMPTPQTLCALHHRVEFGTCVCFYMVSAAGLLCKGPRGVFRLLLLSLQERYTLRTQCATVVLTLAGRAKRPANNLLLYLQ